MFDLMMLVVDYYNELIQGFETWRDTPFVNTNGWTSYGFFTVYVCMYYLLKSVDNLAKAIRNIRCTSYGSL